MTTIELRGRGVILGAVEDMDDTGELYEFGMILQDVEVLADGEDITKEKGKYFKSKDWIKTRYVINEDFPRYYRHLNDSFDLVATFEIDTDDFDPKKLQLIKSDYELEFLPYGIVLDTILYDGEEIYVDDDSEEFQDNFEYGMTGFGIEEVDHMPYVE